MATNLHRSIRVRYSEAGSVFTYSIPEAWLLGRWQHHKGRGLPTEQAWAKGIEDWHQQHQLALDWCRQRGMG